jgi:hypothetical protein
MSSLGQIASSASAFLTNLSSSMHNRRYVAQDILTPVKADRQAGNILKEDALTMFQQIRHLTDGSSRSGEIDVEVSADPFAIDSFSLKTYVSQTELWSSAVAPLDPRVRKLRKLVNAIELLMEIVSAAAIFDATNANWVNGVTKTTVGTKWDAAGGDPIKDILTAKTKIFGYTEGDPGLQMVALFGEQAWLSYRTAALVRASFQAAGGGGAAANENDLAQNAWAQQYAAAQLGVDKVVVGAAKADDGTGTLTDIWTDNVLIAVVAPGETLDSSAFGHTLWFGDTIRRVYEWLDQDRGTDGSFVLKCSTSFLPKAFLNTKGAHLLVDTNT